MGQCILLAKCQHLTRFHIVQRMTPETLMMTLNQEQLALSTTACGTSQKTALTICTGTELTCKRLNGRTALPLLLKVHIRQKGSKEEGFLEEGTCRTSST